MYRLLSECTNVEETINILKRAFVEEKCEISARHVLATITQHAGKTGSISSSIALFGEGLNSKLLRLKFTMRKLLEMPLFLGYPHLLFDRDFLKTKLSPSQKMKMKRELWKGISLILKPILLIPKQIIKRCRYLDPKLTP